MKIRSNPVLIPENNVTLDKINKRRDSIMKKLVRYHSFEALKGDIKTDNTKSVKSKDRQMQMENFLKLLRSKWLEEKELEKKNLKISNLHE